jgi:iron complex transport system ATP-binding protein
MTALAARGLVCRRDDKIVLDAIDLDFAAGQLTVIVGPNGVGKTSLLRLLAGLDMTGAGHVELEGAPLLSIPAGLRASRVAYLPQAANAYWPLRGHDLVALGRLPHGANLSRPLKPVDAQAVRRALDRVRGFSLADRAIDTLSQGERARLMLARALATEAPVLLVDEPVASLDPAYALEAMALLRDEAARGACVAVVLHDLGLAARFADRVVVLSNRRLLADNTPEIALAADVVDAAYGVGFQHIRVDGIALPVAWRQK